MRENNEMRGSYNSSIEVFQTSGTGAAPVIRSKAQIGWREHKK